MDDKQLKLKELTKQRDELEERLQFLNAEIIRLNTTCEHENSDLCEFIKKRASYICKICRRTIM